MEKIYEKPNFITVTYYDNPKFILFDWTKFAVTLAELKDLHMKAYDFIVKYNVKTLIAETSKVKDVLFNEGIEWFGTEHVPRISKAGVTRIITVVPQTALGKLSTKSWQGKVGEIEMYNTESLAEAKKLII